MGAEQHYGRGGLRERIYAGLQAEGRDLENLTEDDLAPVDEFHTRGKAASLELLGASGLREGMRVLDVGCGIGGPSRRLLRYGLLVTGIDLTPEYVELAADLTRRSQLEKGSSFQVGDATKTPFADASFDGAWMQHVNMNIPDKAAVYRELARVIRPGGRLAIHEIVRGSGGEPHLPAPWASDASQSHLVTGEQLRGAIESAGFRVESWKDDTQPSLGFFEAVLAKLGSGPPPNLGLHLIFGPDMKTYLMNYYSSLKEGRCEVIQAVATRI